MEVVTILTTGALCIACFWIGAKCGRPEKTGEFKLPNPVKVVGDYKSLKENREQQDRLNIMLENINNYDGTEMGQKDL